MPAPPPPTSKPTATKKPWRRRLLRLLAWAVLAFVTLPPLQCALLRFVDPPLTLTMLGRSLRHGWQDGDWRLPDHDSTDLSTLPRHVPAAALASEDRGFFSHHGFEWGAIERAWERYRKGAKKMRGGSTISQQVARNVFLTQHRNFVRKGLEAWYTVWLELIVPKRRILEVYLNVAEMGPMVFGIEAAAQHWYGKPAKNLRPFEAARIVAILPSPNRWTPHGPQALRRAAWMAGNPVSLR
jgi:monofunctional biosynthetic peptidoglycan transglycosylase